jgi:hypothetical protein
MLYEKISMMPSKAFNDKNRVGELAALKLQKNKP